MTIQGRPVTSTINDNEYYNVHHLKDYDPAYFYGCIKATKTILKKKSIPEDQYIYATYNEKKDEWNGKYMIKRRIFQQKPLYTYLKNGSNQICLKWLLLLTIMKITKK